MEDDKFIVVVDVIRAFQTQVCSNSENTMVVYSDFLMTLYLTSSQLGLPTIN